MIRFALTLTLLLGAFCFAQTPDPATVPPKEDPTEQNMGGDKVAKDFGITVDSVNALKDQYKIGYGGISKALALAQKSGLTVSEILLMKTEQKMGWGQIAKKLNLEPGKDYKAESTAQKQENAQLKKQAAMEKKAEMKAEKAEQKAEKKALK